MQTHFSPLQSKVLAALDILGIRNLLLGIHDPAFPGTREEDLGRGSPYSRGAADFFAFARALGFNGVQFGPQGITTAANPSPYDGTFFSKNPLSLAPLMFTGPPWDLVEAELLAALTASRHPRPGRVDEAFARTAMRKITRRICRRYRDQACRKAGSRDAAFAAFRRRHAGWLERDALYEILRREYGGRNWKEWRQGKEAGLDRHLHDPPAAHTAAARKRIGTLSALHREAVVDYSLLQYLLAVQHDALRDLCRRLGLKLFGDCQIGLSGRDAWYAQSFLLRNYVMGAPPSRTNPQGQPWNYPLLDPRRYSIQDAGGANHPGPAVRFLRQRADKMFAEFDGLRIDHPHGLVCPWIYRAGREDPLREVQQGARLFASPTLADHPELARFAIVRPDQLNKGVPRHADDWVARLDDEQVGRYAILLDVIMDSARRNGCAAGDIACEILSTQPYPIRRVMELYGLGRFRVTQKADLENPLDVYRSENARPQDWLMLGNHDTPSIWQRAGEWLNTGASVRQAGYLAERLRIPDRERNRWTERTAGDAGALVQAKFADLFVGPARNIMVYFTDLLGIGEAYNRPGTVSADNWSLRIEPDFRRLYAGKLAANGALNIPRALAMALRAKMDGRSPEYLTLIAELEHFPADRER